MRDNGMTTGRVIELRDGQLIVSRADEAGCIVFANTDFIEISGFSEAELLGQPHNIIRHPDMPRAAFKLAWDTIQSGREFFGYVKNMSKDGGFYWVFTHITPDFGAAGQIVGYTSVRRCPRADAVAKIEPVYRAMLAAEQAAGARLAIEAGTAVLVDVMKQFELSYEELVFAL